MAYCYHASILHRYEDTAPQSFTATTASTDRKCKPIIIIPSRDKPPTNWNRYLFYNSHTVHLRVKHPTSEWCIDIVIADRNVWNCACVSCILLLRRSKNSGRIDIFNSNECSDDVVDESVRSYVIGLQ